MGEDIFEAYADTFEAIGNVYGMLINFNLSPSEMGTQKPPTTVARMRLSWEMAKVLTYVLLRYIKKTESTRGVSYPIPTEVLNNLKIAPEDWDALWAPPKFNIGED